ncbi:hypothetical protein ACH4F6_04365 [Streptomyces sp. NPDC017936]|uniref:hypothetical protein n=1 Tax=Streptomyces sp. NPDC017936 TaxID=3365016 RepID=UPI0037AC28E4
MTRHADTTRPHRPAAPPAPTGVRPRAAGTPLPLQRRKEEDSESVHFFHAVGLDYVSCSPFRVPVARLEAGRAALRATEAGDSR